MKTQGATPRIREFTTRWAKPIAAPEKLPFGWCMDNGELHLKVPRYSTVGIRHGVLWKKIHSGRLWRKQGISNEGTLDLSFAVGPAILVEAQGKSWIIDFPVPASGPSILKNAIADGRFYAGSMALHAAVIAILLTLAHFGVQRIWNIAEPEQVETIEEARITSEGGVTVTYRPFEGVTYRDFLGQLRGKIVQSQDIEKLMQQFQKRGNRGFGGSTQLANLSGGSAGIASAGSETSKTVESQKFTQSKGSSSSNLKDTDRAALRAKFNDLQTDFKRLYSKLLSEDPSLSVTVNYEVKVLPTGFFAIESFAAKGNYKNDALKNLQKGMKEIVESVYVGPKYAGLLIRTENIFVR